MNALELADFYEAQSSQVATMLRRQNLAILMLRDVLNGVVSSSAPMSAQQVQNWAAMIQALRETKDVSAVAEEQQPVAQIEWGSHTDYEYRLKMLVELGAVENVPVNLYAGPYRSGGLYWHDTQNDCPANPADCG